MALITCPECGGKMSSTVDSCIHCGAKIKVCPECNELIVGDEVSCKKCGWKPEKKTEEQKDNSFVSLAENGVNKIVATNRIFSVFGIFLLLIGGFLMLYPIITIITFDVERNNLLDLISLSESIESFVIPGMICLIINGILKATGKLVSVQKCNNWLLQERVNVISALSKYLQKDFNAPIPFKEKNAIKKMLEVHVSTTVSKVKSMADFTIELVSSIVFWILAGLVVIDISQGMLACTILNITEYNVFDFVNIPMFIIACVVGIGSWVASIFIVASITNDAHALVSAKLPELNNKYITHLK